MKKCIVLFVAVIVLFALSIDAEADPPLAGFYLGGGATYAWENFDDEGINFDDAWGLNAFAGYRFIKYLAMEGNYNWYSDFESDSFNFNVDLQVWTLMLDLMPMYPLMNDRLVPYVRIGGGYMDAEANAGKFDASESDFACNLGGGFFVFATDSLSLGLDGKYVWGTGDIDGIEYFVGTARIAFHF